MSALKLTNPHSVLAALRTRPRDVLEIHASAEKSQPAWQEAVAVGRDAGVPVRAPLPRGQAGRKFNAQGGRAGTTFALVQERAPLELDELFHPHASRGVWLALDQVQDPHNVGAIFRTAAFFGVQGIMLTTDRSASLTATVYDVATGGLESVPFALQTNLARGIEAAKKADMWVLGSSEHAEQDVRHVDRDRRWLLVVGNEEKGLRRLTVENCDEVCRITGAGNLGSLNVSVAAGILMSALCATD